MGYYNILKTTTTTLRTNTTTIAAGIIWYTRSGVGFCQVWLTASMRVVRGVRGISGVVGGVAQIKPEWKLNDAWNYFASFLLLAPQTSDASTFSLALPLPFATGFNFFFFFFFFSYCCPFPLSCFPFLRSPFTSSSYSLAFLIFNVQSVVVAAAASVILVVVVALRWLAAFF